MTHNFLLEAGRWKIEGTWLERNQKPIIVKGRTLVAWSDDRWFTMVTKLVFPGSEREEISYQYRGRLDEEERQYTYVLQQSLLGQVEGEGWIGPETIIQRYWVLGDRQRRSGFETFYRVNHHTYHLSSGILAGHYLTSTMEAILEAQV
ncbi:hypothetical protein [Gloeothece verrucosa]|uniref:Uncharacterized protein n=1 Tax=Gloeothece verrucosa (strain PCC 7822) TaxID=497965 RepID=E0UGI3_GLOV7|nr:hypothetical protein [Gloeothece verrucosa]ADN12078.1 conserved hypothetical protein [Gloeothece verrucosa PCC 7822]